jgi:hypothetical protein
VSVVGAAEAYGSSGRVGQREFVLKECCLGYKNTLYSSLLERARDTKGSVYALLRLDATLFPATVHLLLLPLFAV